MRPVNFPVWTAITNATTESAAIHAQFYTSASLQVWFSDNAAAGTIKFQGSNDKPTELSGVAPTHWNDLPSPASQVVASGATTLIPSVALDYEYIRVVWTRTGGGGTVTARLKAAERL